MAPALLALPVGPLLAWKRGDLSGALRRLWLAGLVALAAALLIFGLVTPRSLLAACGVALGAWVICGALAEAGERVRAFRAPWTEVGRRTLGLPRGAWGMTLAHVGIGVFALGASFETAWRAEGAEALRLGQSLRLAGYELRLDQVSQEFGPNYVGERALIRVTGRGGRLLCIAAPDRKLYAAARPDHLRRRDLPDRARRPVRGGGDKRVGPAGAPAWLIRVYWNPWVRFIFAGPLLMALGGLMSLSDRRLRFAVTRRARAGRRRLPSQAPWARPGPRTPTRAATGG